MLAAHKSLNLHVIAMGKTTFEIIPGILKSATYSFEISSEGYQRGENKN